MRVRAEIDVLVCGVGTARAVAAIASARSESPDNAGSAVRDHRGVASTGMAFLGVRDAAGGPGRVRDGMSPPEGRDIAARSVT